MKLETQPKVAENPIIEAPKADLKKWIRLAVGVIIGLVFAYMTFRKVNWAEASVSFKQISPATLVLAVGALAIGYAIRILRCQTLYKYVNPDVTYGASAKNYLVSIGLNNVLPFRAGDFARIFGFSKEVGLTSAQILGCMLVERLLDFVALVSMLGICAPANIADEKFQGLMKFANILGGVCLTMLVVLPFAAKFVQKRLPEGKQDGFLGQLATALGPITHLPTFAKLAGFSVVAWIFEGGLFLVVAKALTPAIPMTGPYFAAASATLSTLLPGTPGYVGTFHYFARVALMASGANETSGAVFAIVTHLLVWLPLTVAGLGMLLVIKRKGRVSA